MTSRPRLSFSFSKGFSLIEMLVALAILSILGLAFGKMMADNMAQAAYLEDKMSYQQLYSELKALLSDQSVCNENFLNQTIPPRGQSKRIELKDRTGAVAFSATNEQKNSYDRLRIKRILLKNEDVTVAQKEGRVSVNLQVARERKGGGPTDLRELSESLHVAIRGSGGSPFTVTNCVPSSGGNRTFMIQGREGASGNISEEDRFLPFAKVTFERRPGPAMITAAANIGGGYSDLWYTVRITKKVNDGEEKHLFGWPDGTGYRGAATQSTGSFMDEGTEAGTVTYQLWVEKRSEANGSPRGGSYIQLNSSQIQVVQP